MDGYTRRRRSHRSIFKNNENIKQTDSNNQTRRDVAPDAVRPDMVVVRGLRTERSEHF